MVDGVERDLTTYDLVGADTPRINGYKAKFNPELVETYSVERGSTAATLAAHLYQRGKAAAGGEATLSTLVSDVL